MNRIGWSPFSIDAGPASFWLPQRASNLAEGVDWNWNFVLWINVVFFVLVTAVLLWFVWRYRNADAQPSPSHNMPLELTWTIVPTLIVVYMFWQGYVSYLDMATPPENAYEVQALGQKWNWTFTYPNGYVDPNLHVPVDTAVRVTMTSQDVIHSLFVPAFRVKRDVFPGRYTNLWFTAIAEGEFEIFCAEYCGTSHSKMQATVVVHPPGEFEKWLAEASDFLSKMPPAEAGQLLYNQRGCKQCHSIDGATGTGPSFLALYNSMQPLSDGSQVTADENYIHESIVAPMSKLVAGYEPVMPSYKGRLKDQEIGAIIEYMKTLSR